MLTNFLVLAFVLACATAITTPCRDCNSVGSPVAAAPTGTCKSVTIDPCTAQPCELKRGTNVTFSVEFTAGAAASALTSVVYGVIGGSPVKFPLPNSNGCLKSGINCPVAAGQTYTYTDALYISEIYPSITLVVKWSLLDQDSNTIFCVVAPAKIVGGMHLV